MWDPWRGGWAAIALLPADCKIKGAAPFALADGPAEVCILGVAVGDADADGMIPSPAKAAPPISMTFARGPTLLGASNSRFFSNLGTFGIQVYPS
jgi:hypothetical protein